MSFGKDVYREVNENARTYLWLRVTLFGFFLTATGVLVSFIYARDVPLERAEKLVMHVAALVLTLFFGLLDVAMARNNKFLCKFAADLEVGLTKDERSRLFSEWTNWSVTHTLWGIYGVAVLGWLALLFSVCWGCEPASEASIMPY